MLITLIFLSIHAIATLSKSKQSHRNLVNQKGSKKITDEVESPDCTFDGDTLTISGVLNVTKDDVYHNLAGQGINTADVHNVILKEGIEILKNGLFEDYVGIHTVVFPNTLLIMEPIVFYGCINLVSVILPSNLQLIDYSCFRTCYKLHHVEIPSSLTEIGGHCFAYCSALTTVNVAIPSDLAKIGNNAFLYCTNLINFNIVELTELVRLENGTFNNCHSFTRIILPDSIKVIESYAITSCNALRAIMMPTFVDTIQAAAFNKLDELIVIKYFGERVPNLSPDAFTNIDKRKVLAYVTYDYKEKTFCGIGITYDSDDWDVPLRTSKANKLMHGMIALGVVLFIIIVVVIIICLLKKKKEEKEYNAIDDEGEQVSDVVDPEEI